MRPINGKRTKFKNDYPYEHKRSEGTTRRRNKGSQFIIKDEHRFIFHPEAIK